MDALTPPEWVPVIQVPPEIRLPDSLVKSCCPPDHHLRSAWRYRTATGEMSHFIARYEDASSRKQFKPFAYFEDASGKAEWRCKALPGPRPLYKLDELTARPGAPVLICEGEKAAGHAGCKFPEYVATTSQGGSQGASKSDWTPLAGRDVTIWPDNDASGAKYAQDVAKLALKAGATNVKVVTVPESFPDGWDLADKAPEGADLGALLDEARAEGASIGSDGYDTDLGIEIEIARLAKLCPADYELARKAAAAALGFRATILDKLVDSERPKSDTPGQGRPLELPGPDPWPETVDGAGLLSEVFGVITRFLVCSDPEAVAIALWVMATWFENVAQTAPILNLKSPMARCGKTTALDILGRLSKRPLMAASITPAALFRTIEKCCPTLLVDEADSFFGDNEELRGVVNSGHTRQTAFVIRTVGEDHEPRQFSTWSFKAIAGIGNRPGTIEDSLSR